MDTENFIKQIWQYQKEQDAIYHSVAVKYNLSDTAMWILYAVSESSETYTQQDLCRECFYAKQTVHTAINSLMKNGYVELEVIPKTRNQKKIILTHEGWKLVRNTTDKLREAEFQAYDKLSEDEAKVYIEVTSKLTAFLREELNKL